MSNMVKQAAVSNHLSVESMKMIADTVGLSNLPDDAARILADDVTYKVKTIIKDAGNFVSHSKYKKMMTDDIDSALKTKNVEPMYGFNNNNDFVPFRFASGGGRELYRDTVCKEVKSKVSTTIAPTLSVCSTKRKKKDVTIKATILARTVPKRGECDDLFHYDSNFHDTDESSDGDFVDNLTSATTRSGWNSFAFNTLPPITKIDESEIDRKDLLTHKWVLSNFVKLRQHEVKKAADAIRKELLREKQCIRKSTSRFDDLLEDNFKRVDSRQSASLKSIRKGICCFEHDRKKCNESSLPFTRHCVKHILYNVDQLLFERCTAKCSNTSTQCSNATFDIDRELPLCNHHANMTREQDEDEVLQISGASDVEIKKGKKKPTLSRPGRTKKRKRGGKGVQNTADSSIDTLITIETVKEEATNLTKLTNIPPCINNQKSNSCPSMPTIASTHGSKSLTSSLPAMKNAVGNNHPVPAHSTHSRGTFDNLNTIPLSSSSKTLPTATLSHYSNSGQLQIPPVIDVAVTLAQSDEALVASLVADLPPLSSAPCSEVGNPGFVDADFNDVLNKIPEDAFNDLFVDNLKNGDAPSKEEAEALEEALAIVNQDVQNLAVFAAAAAAQAVSPSNSVGSVLPLNGDSYYNQHHPPNGQTMNNNSRSNMAYNNDCDMLGNLLGSLTKEQQQQLMATIDGAIATGSLTSL